MVHFCADAFLLHVSGGAAPAENGHHSHDFPLGRPFPSWIYLLHAALFFAALLVMSWPPGTGRTGEELVIEGNARRSTRRKKVPMRYQGDEIDLETQVIDSDTSSSRSPLAYLQGILLSALP